MEALADRGGNGLIRMGLGKFRGNPPALRTEVLEKLGCGGFLDKGAGIPEGGAEKVGPAIGLKVSDAGQSGFAYIGFWIEKQLEGEPGLILQGKGSGEINCFEADIDEGIFGEGKEGGGRDLGRARGGKPEGLLAYFGGDIGKEVEKILGWRRPGKGAQPDGSGPGPGG